MKEEVFEKTGKICSKCSVETVKIKRSSVHQNHPDKGTGHHILPRHYFLKPLEIQLDNISNKTPKHVVEALKKQIKKAKVTIHLCHRDHVELEKIIREAETFNGRKRKRLLYFQYELIVEEFCKGGFA